MFGIAFTSARTLDRPIETSLPIKISNTAKISQPRLSNHRTDHWHCPDAHDLNIILPHLHGGGSWISKETDKHRFERHIHALKSICVHDHYFNV